MRFRYEDAIAQFGCDKPDLNPVRIQNVSDVFKDTTFRVFREVLDQQGGVFAVKVADLPQLPSRKYFDDTVESFLRDTGFGLADPGALRGGPQRHACQVCK